MPSDPAPGSRTSAPRFIAFSALFLALAVLLPIGFHAFGLGGRLFLPMHIPVLLAGFIAGPYAGLIIGLLAPSLSFLLTGMPPTYAVPLMSMELPMYGLVAGITYRSLHFNIYVALILAMIVGRLMFALGLLLLGNFMELPYSAAQFFSAGGAVVAGLPGIAVQLVIIPLLVAALKRTRFGTELH
ncbi:MAG: ECF transporter S component [bacterium]|nr:ECF transporter S component [bacterium]